MTRWPISYALSGAVAAAVLAPVVILVSMVLGADIAVAGRSVQIIVNTALLTLLTVAGATLIGVPMAVATEYTDLPGRRFWLAALSAPLAVPSYIGAFAYFAAFGPAGEIHHVLGIWTPGLRGLGGAALVMTLYTFPFVLLTTRAALRNLDANMVDAARTLGLPLHTALRRVVLPRIRNGVAAGALLVAMYTLTDFATPAIMGLDTFTRVIYVEYNAFGLHRAALLSLQLLALVAVVLFLESRVGHTPGERPSRTLLLRLNRIQKATLTICAALVAATAIVLPVGIFGLWLARAGVATFDPMHVWNSIYPSLLAAIAAVVAALPVAYAASIGRIGQGLERISYLGFGIPGIVMGTALVYLGLQLTFLYQTLALLVLGYTLRFLPLAVGAVRATAERIGGNLTGAARSLGAPPGEAFRRVSLPLTLPGITAGGALVFLEAMRELPTTLLLRPTGLQTLATYLWRVYEAGYFARAAVPGLLLILVSSAAMMIMLSGERRLSRIPAT